MGILNDIAKRDLSGGKKIENLLRPSTRPELNEIIRDEIKRQGKDVDLRHVIVSDMNSFNYLFNDYDEIESLDLTGWDTSHIKMFSRMFSGCRNLKSIKGIENWDVSEGHEFISMFDGCKNLETIDLSGWRIDFGSEKEYEIINMFCGCDRLKKIIGFENWNIPKWASAVIKRGFCKHITDDGIVVR